MLEPLTSLHAALFDPARLPVAAMAVLLTALLGAGAGPLAGEATPLFYRVIDSLFGGIGTRMDKGGRSRGTLILRGLGITVLTLIVSLLIGRGMDMAAKALPLWNIIDILALSALLTCGALWRAVFRLYTALERKSVGEGAYFIIARTARLNLTQADDYTITRAGMGLAVRTLDKGLVAPLLWYLIAGLPGAVVYSGLAALVWRFGKDGRGSGFATFPLAIEKLMGVVPSMFTGFLVSLACVFTPTAMMSRALSSFTAHKDTAPYEEGGWPASALAWGLNVTLGGIVTDRDGAALRRVWAGPPTATAQLEPRHLHRALYAVIMAAFLLFAGLVGAMIVSGHQLLDF